MSEQARTINLNDMAIVRLQTKGERLYDAYYYNLGLDPERYRAHEVQADGRYRMPLWELFHIFGPHTSMGPQLPFETEIELAPK